MKVCVSRWVGGSCGKAKIDSVMPVISLLRPSGCELKMRLRPKPMQQQRGSVLRRGDDSGTKKRVWARHQPVRELWESQKYPGSGLNQHTVAVS